MSERSMSISWCRLDRQTSRMRWPTMPLAPSCPRAAFSCICAPWANRMRASCPSRPVPPPAPPMAAAAPRPAPPRPPPSAALDWKPPWCWPKRLRLLAWLPPPKPGCMFCCCCCWCWCWCNGCCCCWGMGPERCANGLDRLWPGKRPP